MSEVIDLPIAEIYPHVESRPVDQKKVEAIAASVESIGLLNPIIVRRAMKMRMGREIEAWEILAGNHRYEACSTVLQWDTIPCVVRNDDDLRAELVMIDENLCRAELSPAQKSYQVARRKEIYEALHPEARHGVAGAIGRWNADDNLSSAFSDATAQATGLNKRTIQRDAARGEALGETLKDIAGTSLDKGVELDALVRLDPDKRADAISKVKSGEIRSVREYDAAGPSGIDRELKIEAARNIASRLAEWCPPSEWEWLKSSLYTAGAKAVADAFINETGAGVATMDRANSRWS
ncbi:ParB/RepB/Spo0J family partition protein [Xanthobacter sp. ZOL 2024]